jgi:hypothetical protein
MTIHYRILGSSEEKETEVTEKVSTARKNRRHNRRKKSESKSAHASAVKTQSSITKLIEKKKTRELLDFFDPFNDGENNEEDDLDTESVLDSDDEEPYVNTPFDQSVIDALTSPIEHIETRRPFSFASYPETSANKDETSPRRNTIADLPASSPPLFLKTTSSSSLASDDTAVVLHSSRALDTMTEITALTSGQLYSDSGY